MMTRRCRRASWRASGENLDVVIKDTLVRAGVLERADELSDVSRGDVSFRRPLLRLDVDHVEAEPVFADDTVDATVSASTHAFGGIALRTAVPHSEKHIENKLFKESIVSRKDTREKFLTKRASDFCVRRLDRFFRRLGLLEGRIWIGPGWGGAVRALVSEVPELLERVEDAVVEAVWMVGEDGFTPVGDASGCSARAIEKPSANEIGRGPPDAIVESLRRTARQPLIEVVFREVELAGESVPESFLGSLVSVGVKGE